MKVEDEIPNLALMDFVELADYLGDFENRD